MKKLILLLMLIPTFSFAEKVCPITEFIIAPSEENDFKVPLWHQEIEEKMTKRGCKKNDVLWLDVYPPRDKNGIIQKNSLVTEGVIHNVAARNCNFNKTIITDVDGLNFNLVCVIK